jgi:hypothetical protein
MHALRAHPIGYSGNQQYSFVIIGTMIAPLPENLAPLSSNMRIGDHSRRAPQEGAVCRATRYNFSIGLPRNFSSRELVNLRGHADAFRVQGSIEESGRPRAANAK